MMDLGRSAAAMARRAGLALEEDRGLLPVSSPLFALREACKALILLEDHLVHAEKRCVDCVRKHLLAAEAFFEEAASLDVEGRWHHLTEGMPEAMRDLLDEIESGEADPREVAGRLREIRKALVPECVLGHRSS